MAINHTTFNKPSALWLSESNSHLRSTSCFFNRSVLTPKHPARKIAFIAQGLDCHALVKSKPEPCKRLISCSVAAKEASVLPNGATEVDAEYMRLCVRQARNGLGCTSPNPMVGCVIVKDGQIVGRGFHPKAGEPHAEVFALREAGAMAEGATAYVSLEPCNHYGRTPPCTQALIKARVKCVVVGMMDPNPIVAGKGVATLEKSGIEVIVGVEEALCWALNEAYIHRMLERKPFATLRFSMSLDGGFLGSSLENSGVGGYFSKLLQENDAVIVPDAAVYDNPVLLSSENGAKQPLRVVLARSLDLPLDSYIFDTSLAPTLVLADEQAVLADVQSTSRQGGQSMEFLLQERGVDVITVKELNLDFVLDVCYQRGFCSVLFDSRGPDLSGLENFLGRQAIEEEVVQKLVVAILPVICGDKRNSPGFNFGKDMLCLERISTRMSGKEVIVEGYIPK